MCLTLCNLADCILPGSSVHGIPKGEYWSKLPFPSPGNHFLDPGMEPVFLASPALAGSFCTMSQCGSPGVTLQWESYLWYLNGPNRIPGPIEDRGISNSNWSHTAEVWSFAITSNPLVYDKVVKNEFAFNSKILFDIKVILGVRMSSSTSVFVTKHSVLQGPCWEIIDKNIWRSSCGEGTQTINTEFVRTLGECSIWARLPFADLNSSLEILGISSWHGNGEHHAMTGKEHHACQPSPVIT